MAASRLFRLFVSSTFSDFIAEREELQRRVFPELEKYCAEKGARFQAVDLRWGITEEAQREHDTMRICLEEIRRCQQLSPRPNFAVLLGDRYGWEPVPARIPQDHWKRLIKAASKADRELIEQSYRLDENAVPPVSCLLERGKNQSEAFEHEANLLQALRRAARGFRGAARLPYFASATHQEIALGALSRRDEKGDALLPEQHVYVYIRHIEGVPQDESAKDFIDWDASTGQVVPGARQRLRGLEAQLRRQLGSHVHDLRTVWTRHGRNGAVNKAYLKRFSDVFLSHQKALIDAELATLAQTDERQQREQAHQAFGEERARVFAGRKALLAKIARYTTPRPEGKGARTGRKSARHAPLVLLGGGGSGKSALLARAAKEGIQHLVRSGAIVMQRYIGGVPGTESLMTMLAALTADIASSYGQPEPPVPENAKALAEEFQAALGHATAKQPLILYLDALDQLDKADNAWMLEWLPRDLPEHVRVVVSLRTETNVAQTARRRYPRSLVEVSGMKPAEGHAMLNAWLADKRAAWFDAGIAPSTGRRLTSRQQQAVLKGFNKNGSALWLKLAYEEAAAWASWDLPRQLPPTVQGLIENLLDRRLIGQENHPKVFTERALGYLSAGRLGLSETELGRALATDSAVRAEFQANEKTQRRWENDKALPPILWSRLFFDLQPYLGLAKIDGALVMRWFHREFAEVLKSRYLGSDEDRLGIHGALADTFLQLERELRSDETTDDALFKASDASGKQVSAALRRVMEQPWQLAQAGRNEDMQALLTDFGFCMGKCAANRSGDLIHDYLLYDATWQDGKTKNWQTLMTSKAHLLRLGSPEWPSHRILLQVAMEHADASLITLSASDWLETGLCDWVWVKRLMLPRQAPNQQSPIVLSGHTNSVLGAGILADSRVFSWAWDGSIRVWNSFTGDEESIITVVKSRPNYLSVQQFLRIDSEWLLIIFSDGSLRIWNEKKSASPTKILEHKSCIQGVQITNEGGALSYSDFQVQYWHKEKKYLFNAPPRCEVSGACLISEGKILVWYRNEHNSDLWSYKDSEATKQVPLGKIWQAFGSDNELLLTLDFRNKVTAWSTATWEKLGEWRFAENDGIQFLNGPKWLVISDSKAVDVYDTQELLRDPLSVFSKSGKLFSNLGRFIQIENGKLLLWSDDKKISIWDLASGKHQVLQEMPFTIQDLWAADETEAVVQTGEKLLYSVNFELQTVTLLADDYCSGCAVAAEKVSYVTRRDSVCTRLLKTPEKTLETEPLVDLSRPFIGHNGVQGAVYLPDHGICAWGAFGTIGIWDHKTGRCLWSVSGEDSDPPFEVDHVGCLPSGDLISWGHNEFHIFAPSDGSLVASFTVPYPREIAEYPVLFGVLPKQKILVGFSDNKYLRWDIAGNGITLLDSNAPIVKQYGSLLQPFDATAQFNNVKFEDGRYLTWEADKLFVNPEPINRVEQEKIQDLSHRAVVLPAARLFSYPKLWSIEGKRPRILRDLELTDKEEHRARALKSGNLLTWDETKLYSWRGLNGEPLGLLGEHPGKIEEVIAFADDRLLTWSKDGAVRIWNEEKTCDPVVIQAAQEVYGASLTSTGLVLLWTRGSSSSQAIEVFDGDNGKKIRSLEGHEKDVLGTTELTNNRVLAWSTDKIARIWQLDGMNYFDFDSVTLVGHRRWIKGGIEIDKDIVLTWSNDRTFRLWSASDGTLIRKPIQSSYDIDGCLKIAPGEWISWSKDELCLWNKSNLPLPVQSYHQPWIFAPECPITSRDSSVPVGFAKLKNDIWFQSTSASYLAFRAACGDWKTRWYHSIPNEPHYERTLELLWGLGNANEFDLIECEPITFIYQGELLRVMFGNQTLYNSGIAHS